MAHAPHDVPENQQSLMEFPPQSSRPEFLQTHRGALFLAAIAALATFAIGVLADLIVLRSHELTAGFMVEISDGVSAFVIGLLSYKVVRLQQLRSEQIRHKLEVIADMNHHVRNALQVISLTTHGSGKEELIAIRESMNRIQWALRELLPKI